VHFIGLVKTATKKFPKEIFETWESTKPTKGESIFLTAKVNIDGQDHTLLATDWMTKVGKRIISTCSNGRTSQYEHIVERSRVIEVEGTLQAESYSKHTQQSEVVEELFRCFSVIDVHDHYRQGTLALERHWKTHNWWHRLFCTVAGVVYTDCFFAYRHDFLSSGADTNAMMEYEEFLGTLASSMIFNELDMFHKDYLLRNIKRKHEDRSEMLLEEEHPLKSLSDTPYYQSKKASSPNHQFDCRRKCKVCHEKTSFYCVTCTVAENFFPICGNTRGKKSECYITHRLQIETST